MSYLDKLQQSLKKKDNKKIPEVNPGWIILNKEKYIKDIDTQENLIHHDLPIKETENNSEISIQSEYTEDFHIKYGDILLDFFMDMEQEYQDNCYNILDTKEYGSCFSYDFEKFIMENTQMINNEENLSSISGDEDNIEDFNI